MFPAFAFVSRVVARRAAAIAFACFFLAPAVGAGWNRHSETTGRDYVSLSLAAPEFGPRRLYANLGRAAGGAEDSFALIWNPAD